MYDDIYGSNVLASTFGRFVEMLFGKKAESIIDNPLDDVEIGQGVTWHTFGRGVKSIYDKNGNVSFDRPFTKSETKLLKSALYSKFNGNPDDLDHGLKNYFLHEQGISSRLWDSLDNESKQSNFQYGLNRMITRDALSDFELKKKNALKDKNITITDEDNQFYDNLKKNYDQKSDGLDWSKMTDNYMDLLSKQIFGQEESDSSFMGRLGSFFNDVYIGLWIGTAGGIYGKLIGGLAGGIYGILDGFSSYMGKEGDDVAYTKALRDSKNMLSEYYGKSDKVNQTVALYKQHASLLSEDGLNKLIEDFDSIATNLSPKYEQYLKDNMTKEEKLDMMSEFYANQQATGSEHYAAIKLQLDIQNTAENKQSKIAENKQSKLDVLVNSGALFTDMTLGTLMSGVGLLYGIIGAPGSDNDAEHINDSYWNNIIDNGLTRYANNVTTLHVWSPEQLELYKQKGWTDNEILLTTDELASLLNLKSFPEVLAQFGFTFGTMALSKVGSKALNATMGKVKKLNKERFFKSDLPGAGRTAAKRLMLLQNIEDAGHVFIAGSTGTLEGGMEGIQTYEQTYNKYMGILNNQIDQQAESKLLQMREDPEYLYNVYRSIGGDKNIDEFTDESGNVDSDAIIDEIIRTNSKQNKLTSPKDNPLANVLGIAPSDELLQEMHEDAWKAGYIDFWINSLINGYINTTLKAGQHSKYARLAIDKFFGNKNRQFENIKISGSKGTGFSAEAEKMTKGKMFLQRIKEAHGEGLEEYYQELASAFGQGFVENEMLHNVFSKYGNTSRELVFDDFATNMSIGLSKVHEKATSAEAIKSYLYGALSTLIGGVSVKNNYITKQDIDEYGGNFIDRLSSMIPALTWRTGFSPLFTNTERNKINAEREQVAERLNNFFNDKDKQDMLFNVVDAISHGRVSDILNELGQGDFADDERYKSLIDTLTIVNKLKGTLYGDSVLAALKGRANWEKYVKRDNAGNAIVEGLSLDNQIDVAQQQLQQAVAANDEDAKTQALNDIRRLSELKSAVTEFQKNATKEEKQRVGTSENQIIAEAASVASSTLQSLDQVDKALKEVDAQYGKNLDDDVKESWVKTLMYKNYVEAGLEKLKEQYKDYFTELQSQDDTLPNSLRNGFSAAENSVIVRYGTSDNVRKEIEKLLEELKDNQSKFDTVKADIERRKKTANLNDHNVLTEMRLSQLAMLLTLNNIEITKTKLNYHKNALKLLEQIDKKKEALGMSENEEVVIGLADMALLDPMAFFELINENNSNKFSTALKEVITRAKAIANSNRFDADMQRMGWLSKELDRLALELVNFRTNPAKYNEIVLYAKDAANTTFLKGKHKDFFNMNLTGLTVTEDGESKDVSVSEFTQEWEKIKKEYENLGDKGKYNISQIENILRKQESKALAKGKQTLYGKYRQIESQANADTLELKKTGYWNSASELIKRTISALHKYARSLGKKFNEKQHDYSEGGKIITIDDVLTDERKVVEDFKTFLENEGIHENEYNTEQFTNQLAELLSSGEQTKISEALEELQKSTTEQNITDNDNNSNPAPEPVVEKTETQEDTQLGITLDEITLIITDIDKSNLNDEAEQRILNLLSSLLSRGDVTGVLINVLNSYMNNTSFTQNERNFWTEVYRKVNKPVNNPVVPITVTDGITGGIVSLMLTPPAYVPSNNPSNTDKINELISRYMGDRLISKALQKLLTYLNSNNKPSICFIVDTTLTQDIRNVDGSRNPAVMAAIEITSELKNNGLNFDIQGLIEIDGKQYQIIGALNDVLTVTLGLELMAKANQQLQNNQRPFVIKVNGNNLVTNNFDYKTDYLNNTAIESSIFQKFQEKMRNRGIHGEEQQFKEFLKHLYYVEIADENDPLKKRNTWVYREEPHEDYDTVYKDYNKATDIELTPSDIVNLTYKDTSTGTYRRLVDFFRPQQNTVNYSTWDEPFFIHLAELFGGNVNGKFRRGSLYPKIANFKAEDFDKDGNLNEDGRKAIENELRNYFYWDWRGTTFRVINENGFLKAYIYDSAGVNEICSFMLATPAPEGSDNMFSCDMDCGYSMIHNMLYEKDNITLRDQSLLKFKIQLDFGTLKQAIEYVAKEEYATEEEAKNRKRSFDRVLNLFTKKGTFFTTSKASLEPRISNINIKVDELLPTVVTDNVSNPTGADPNLTLRGTDENTGEANGQLDNPPSEYTEADKIAEQMKRDSTKLSLNSDETAYVSEDGKYVGERLTHFINPQDEDDNNRKTVATSFGNYVDSIFELVFTFSKAEDLLALTDEQLYLRYGISKNEVEDFKNFVGQVITLKQQLQQQYPGLKFVQGRVTTAATVKNKQTGELTNVSGTADIIGYDKNGNWYLFDVKTTRLAVYDKSHLDSRMNENEEYWSNQLEGYARSLEEKYGIKFAVTQDIVVPLTYSSSFYSDELIYQQEENSNVNHKVLKDGSGKPVTGWIGKRSGRKSLMIHLTSPNMREKSKFWDNYEMANGEKVEEQPLTQNANSNINFTFGVVENNEQNSSMLDPVLAEMLGLNQASVDPLTLQLWSEQNLRGVLDGKKTLTLTDPVTGNKRVITSKELNQYVEHAIDKAKNSSSVSEEQKEKMDKDLIISDLSSLNPQVAMRTLINDFDCM